MLRRVRITRETEQLGASGDDLGEEKIPLYVIKAVRGKGRDIVIFVVGLAWDGASQIRQARKRL